MISFGRGVTCCLEDHESIQEVNRRHRRDVARHFAETCIFEGVRQHIVRSTGPELLLGDRMYYGVMLVAVYGMDSSICVVTKRNELDMRRVLGPLRKHPRHVVICRIGEVAISEIEGHAFDGDSETKPFGFVSVPVSNEESGQPASSSEYDEEKAINFLTRKMRSGLACTFDETVKTTIWAFKHLCLKEVKAEELWVTFFKGHGHPPPEPLLVNEIQNYVDIINGASGRGGTDSHMDSDLGGFDMDCLDSDVYSYRDSDVNSLIEDSDVDMDLDANRFATDQEIEECNKLVNKKISEYKKVLSVRRYSSISVKIGGYSIENVSITSVGSCDTRFWMEESYGLVWIAVHGMKSICMVARHNDLDMTRVGPLLKGNSEDTVMYALARAVLSDIEDFPDEKRESSGLIINVPFGVVSMNVDMIGVVHHDLAVAFLEEKMRNGSVVTADETIETAIHAFQHLCPEELKAEDIYVCTCGELGDDSAVPLTMDEIEHYILDNTPQTETSEKLAKVWKC